MPDFDTTVAGLRRWTATCDPHVRAAGLRIHKAGVKLDGREHATRVAWRVAKDWLEAVLALVAAGMATIDEVMLPYLHIQIGGEEKVLWQHYRDQEQAALLPGSDRA